MKKTISIAICILGIICLSSCRSTSSPCGLSGDASIEQQPTTPLQNNSFSLTFS